MLFANYFNFNRTAEGKTMQAHFKKTQLGSTHSFISI